MIKFIKNVIAENRTVNELSRLSNRELNDLGIDRSQIRSIAKQHVSMTF